MKKIRLKILIINRRPPFGLVHRPLVKFNMVRYYFQVMKKYLDQKLIKQTLNQLSPIISKNKEIYDHKIRQFNNWAQVHSPSVFKPIINYTLAWLSPQLIGTGFKILKLSEDYVEAVVPSLDSNLDQQQHINLGLVTNAGVEMVRAFLTMHLQSESYNLEHIETRLIKKLNWTKDLSLKLHMSNEVFETQFIQYQKNKSHEFEFKILILLPTEIKADLLKIKVQVSKNLLLS